MTNKDSIYNLEKIPMCALEGDEFEAIQHAIEVLKRFDGAVEVDEVTTDSDNVQDYFKIVMHSEVSPFKPIGTSKTHKLYAIPKPKEE